MALIICSTLFITSCGDLKYKEIVKSSTPEDIFYVAVRKDMTLISNIYESVSLTELGLSQNSYMVWGDADHAFFALPKSSGGAKIMEYVFETKSLTSIFEFAKSKLIFSPDGNRFYSAYAKDTGMLGFHRYYLYIDLWEMKNDAYSNALTKEVDDYPAITKGNSLIVNFLSSVSDYAWETHIPGSDRIYFPDECSYFVDTNTGTGYQPHLMEDWSDPVWKYIIEQQGLILNSTTFFDYYGNAKTVFGKSYERSIAYFEYTFEGDLIFITEDSNSFNPITAIYTFN